MLKKEKNYDFRKRMLEIHKKNIRNNQLKAENNETVLEDGAVIYVSENAGEVIITAAKDFVDFLFTSMNISVRVKKGTAESEENSVIVTTVEETPSDMGTANGYKGFRADIGGSIIVCGYDERGAAQGLYYLEEQMIIRRAPYLKNGTVFRKPEYSPQMVHSGYGLDEYPDEHLSAIAHEGRDAILIFTKDVNITPYGYLDFNELIHRAAKYGIDVYAYSYLPAEKHPEDEGAAEYYEEIYGRLFEKCPGLKGISLVGESVMFPSKDEKVCYNPDFNVLDKDGLPTGKPLSGFWPCKDFPQWLELVKNTIRRHKPDADIVFWTYNWGRQPKAERIKLINALPTDISLMATFEMFEYYKIDGLREQIADYSLRFTGPGKYFTSEAEAAKKRNIRLYSMTNTGGLTWDFGVIPYEPMPFQWIKRFDEMRKAHDMYGLCGIMESHHYGFYPSFVSRLGKFAFTDRETSYEQQLRDAIAYEFGIEHMNELTAVLKLWSEAINYYTPTDNDMYGAFRIGPSYPFCLFVQTKPPAKEYALNGNGIFHTEYNTVYAHEVTFDKGSPVSLKLQPEINSLAKMKTLMDKGIEILEQIENANDNILYLLNLGKFISISIKTGINAKLWYRLKSRMNACEDKKEFAKIIDDMESLLKCEIENAESAVDLVEYDSRLGWEPSMEYMTDREHIEWKIKQVNYVIDTELKNLKTELKG